MSDRLLAIERELEINAELTKKCKERINPVKVELGVTPPIQENKERIIELKALLFGLDKEYNKLRADFYFLSNEKKEEIKRTVK